MPTVEATEEAAPFVICPGVCRDLCGQLMHCLGGGGGCIPSLFVLRFAWAPFYGIKCAVCRWAWCYSSAPWQFLLPYRS